MASPTPTSLKLDPDLKDRVVRLAADRRRSAHWVMREAIAQYVDREEAQTRFYRDALAAWEGYQTDGRHVSATAADTWLAKLEAGEDAPPPAAVE